MPDERNQQKKGWPDVAWKFLELVQDLVKIRKIEWAFKFLSLSAFTSMILLKRMEILWHYFILVVFSMLVYNTVIYAREKTRIY